jgi:hypothetical protein
LSRFTTNSLPWKGAQSSYGRLVFPSVPVLWEQGVNRHLISKRICVLYHNTRWVPHIHSIHSIIQRAKRTKALLEITEQRTGGHDGGIKKNGYMRKATAYIVEVKNIISLCNVYMFRHDHSTTDTGPRTPKLMRNFKYKEFLWN